jgi:hypothetical protein
MKYDNEKPKLQLIPPHALNEAAKVFGFGAEKYAENNWRKDIDMYGWTRHYGSIQRHLNAWLACEDIDPDSGLPHIAHALTQLMILNQVIKDAPQCDDRFKDGSKQNES